MPIEFRRYLSESFDLNNSFNHFIPVSKTAHTTGVLWGVLYVVIRMSVSSNFRKPGFVYDDIWDIFFEEHVLILILKRVSHE